MQNQTEIDRALPVVEGAPAAADDAKTLFAAIREFEQRVNAGKLSREERTDLGGDMLALAESLTNFALRVLA